MNNVAVAFFLAGLLQPPLIYVQSERVISLVGALVSLLFLAASLIFVVAAQSVLGRWED